MSNNIERLTSDLLSFFGKRGFNHLDPIPVVQPASSPTLFTIAGVQNFGSINDDILGKGKYMNVQPCLRMDDINSISNKNTCHHVLFNMFGLFDYYATDTGMYFDLFIDLLDNLLPYDSSIDVKVHPKLFSDLSTTSEHDFKAYCVRSKCNRYYISKDEGMVWKVKDSETEGYCIEFYVDDIEILNMVFTPIGNHYFMDVGVGLERLNFVVNEESATTKEKLLAPISALLEEGVTSSNKKHGYVLRKLIRMYLRLTNTNTTLLESLLQESKALDKITVKARQLLNGKTDVTDVDKAKLFDTYGIDEDTINFVLYGKV